MVDKTTAVSLSVISVPVLIQHLSTLLGLTELANGQDAVDAGGQKAVLYSNGWSDVAAHTPSFRAPPPRLNSDYGQSSGPLAPCLAVRLVGESASTWLWGPAARGLAGSHSVSSTVAGRWR